jgi:hypothetical protein
LNKLAAGVVDPGLCLLNPAYTWIKRGNGWEPKQAKGWDVVWIDETDRPADVQKDAVLRAIKTGHDGKERWTVYVDKKKNVITSWRRPGGGKGEVQRISLLSVSSKSSLLLCDGTKVELSQLNDILIGASFGCH